MIIYKNDNYDVDFSENSDTCGQGGGGKIGKKCADALYGWPLLYGKFRYFLGLFLISIFPLFHFWIQIIISPNSLQKF